MMEVHDYYIMAWRELRKKKSLFAWWFRTSEDEIIERAIELKKEAEQ